MTTSRAGWYDDPHDTEHQRWWDGKQWTVMVRRRVNYHVRVLIITAIVLMIVIIGAIGLAVASRAVTNYRQNQFNQCIAKGIDFNTCATKY